MKSQIYELRHNSVLEKKKSNRIEYSRDMVRKKNSLPAK
jgi:hypothetical protein